MAPTEAFTSTPNINIANAGSVTVSGTGDNGDSISVVITDTRQQHDHGRDDHGQRRHLSERFPILKSGVVGSFEKEMTLALRRDFARFLCEACGVIRMMPSPDAFLWVTDDVIGRGRPVRLPNVSDRTAGYVRLRPDTVVLCACRARVVRSGRKFTVPSGRVRPVGVIRSGLCCPVR